MKKAVEIDTTKRIDHVDSRGRVEFEYPLSYTAQQCGLTRPGSPGLNFSKMRELSKTTRQSLRKLKRDNLKTERENFLKKNPRLNQEKSLKRMLQNLR